MIGVGLAEGHELATKLERVARCKAGKGNAASGSNCITYCLMQFAH